MIGIGFLTRTRPKDGTLSQVELTEVSLVHQVSEEQDPYHCPKCGAPYNNADPTSHACPEAQS